MLGSTHTGVMKMKRNWSRFNEILSYVHWHQLFHLKLGDSWRTGTSYSFPYMSKRPCPLPTQHAWNQRIYSHASIMSNFNFSAESLIAHIRDHSLLRPLFSKTVLVIFQFCLTKNYRSFKIIVDWFLGSSYDKVLLLWDPKASFTAQKVQYR